jgi:hypothetical protein
MLAALTWMLEKQVANCVTAPHYFNACRKWHDGLSCEHRETVLRVVEAYTYWANELRRGSPPACPRPRAARSEGHGAYSETENVVAHVCRCSGRNARPFRCSDAGAAVLSRAVIAVHWQLVDRLD